MFRNNKFNFMYEKYNRDHVRNRVCNSYSLYNL